MKIRLPEELRAMIEAAAGKSGRSLNQEIINRLHRSFADVESLLIRNRMSELKAVRQQLWALKRHHDALSLAASHDEPGLEAEIEQVAETIRRMGIIEANISTDLADLTSDQDVEEAEDAGSDD